MAIPYYIARPSGVMGLNEDDPDAVPAGPFDGVPAEEAAKSSPFEAPPPSVDESKATKSPHPNPFDEVDPRIKELDDQIRSRPSSIGGILAAFSPHGDRTLANLMAQRHLVGGEVHGDRQIQRQLESSRMINESQMRHWDTLAQNNQRNNDVKPVVAGINAAPRQAAVDEKAREFDNPRAKEFAPQHWQPMGITTIGGKQYMVSSNGTDVKQIPLDGTLAPLPKDHPPQKPTVDYAMLIAQKKIVGLQQQLTKLQATDPTSAAIPELQRQLIIAKKEAGLFGVKNPSAAPSTAPAVSGSGGPTDNDPLGIRN